MGLVSSRAGSSWCMMQDRPRSKIKPDFGNRPCMCRASVAVELGKLFVSKAQREVFQAMVGRRTQQAVTSAELDFMCPPTHSLLVTVTSMLQADAAARNLSSWCAFWNMDFEQK